MHVFIIPVTLYYVPAVAYLGSFRGARERGGV